MAAARLHPVGFTRRRFRPLREARLLSPPRWPTEVLSPQTQPRRFKSPMPPLREPTYSDLPAARSQDSVRKPVSSVWMELETSPGVASIKVAQLLVLSQLRAARTP